MIIWDVTYNSNGAKDRLNKYFNTIDNRADFFGASNQYEKNIGSGARWFGGAEQVSNAFITGLGAKGNFSSISFFVGNAIALGGLYEWRQEAGDKLLQSGFDNFRDLYNLKRNPVQWDVKQLKDEQNSLQSIHEKYLGSPYKSFFLDRSKWLTDASKNDFINRSQQQPGGIDILDKSSRIRYGCKLLGYTSEQGCKP